MIFSLHIIHHAQVSIGCLHVLDSKTAKTAKTGPLLLSLVLGELKLLPKSHITHSLTQSLVFLLETNPALDGEEKLLESDATVLVPVQLPWVETTIRIKRRNNQTNIKKNASKRKRE